MDFGARQVSFTSSSASWKSCDVVSDQFPAGLRVLVVDDDPTCLRILEKMLKKCLYEVTTSNRAEVALKLLRENKNGYDIVLSDVHMPDMDGFKLLEHVGLEMDLPVIMMSADDSKHVVMKGVTHGACDYLIKPVSIEALKNIWQHVVRKRKHEWKEKEAEQSASVEEQKPPEDIDCSSSANEGSWKSSKRRKDEEDEGEERDDSSTLKKPRVVWSVELHQQFVNAVNQLGIDKAVPKKILELMNVPGLTRENVASHLQKYRLYLRRLSGVQQHQNGLGTSFPGPPDATFGPISSLELQALAASGHLPPHSLATIQAAALGRATTKSPISVPDQRNIFSFENPKLNNPKQVNLLHGIPTNMDSKQLASLHQSAAQSFSNVHMNLHSQASQSNPLLKQMLQPIKESLLPNFSAQAVSSHVIPGIRGPAHGNNSPSPVSNARMSTPTSKIQSEVSSENKESRGFVPNNNVFGDLNQNRVQDWHLQNVVSAFEAPRRSNVHGALNGLTPVLTQPGVSSNQKGGQSNMLNTNPQLNSSFAGNQSRNRAERLPDLGFQNGLLSEQFGQEDLMSALLKQQEVLGPVENEFGFDGYPLDNLPVSRAHAS